MPINAYQNHGIDPKCLSMLNEFLKSTECRPLPINAYQLRGRRSNGSAMKVSADRRTDGQTDRRYQVHYLPDLLSYAVDKKDQITYLNFKLIKSQFQLGSVH